MRTCTFCNNLTEKNVFPKNNGLCDACAGEKATVAKIRRDFLTSFAGKGKRGFMQWLRMGGVLQELREDVDVHAHNDRMRVVDLLIGGQQNLDKVLSKMCDAIIELAREKDAADDED